MDTPCYQVRLDPALRPLQFTFTGMAHSELGLCHVTPARAKNVAPVASLCAGHGASHILMFTTPDNPRHGGVLRGPSRPSRGAARVSTPSSHPTAPASVADMA